MPNATIRNATPADVDRIAEIAVTAWQPVFDEFRRAAGDENYDIMFPLGNKRKDAELRRICADCPDNVIVTEVDGIVVGFATYFVIGEKLGEVGNNAVHPDYQGQGIGTGQMQEILRRLKEAGCEVVKVFTGLDPAHGPARAMYEKAGFRQWWQMVTYIREL